MKVKLFLTCAVVLLLGQHCTIRAEDAAVPAEGTNKLHHTWEYIYYPSLKYEGTNFLLFLVSPNQGRNLRLDIMTHSVNPPAMLKKGNVSARLHRANGEVLDIEEKNRGAFEHALGFSTGMSLDGGMDFSIMAFFPWSTNALEESWFEVHIGQECYWVEVPYGFDQDPKNVSLQSVAGGPPTNAPAMKQLGSHDHVVHWDHVQYDVCNLPGGWNVSLNQSNPFYASSEVILYGEHWSDRNLFTPRTAVRILDADGSVRNGFCWDIHLVDGAMRRSDTFHLGASDDKTRCWSQIEISVDATNTCQTLIPSSLYKYCHGHGYEPIRQP